MSPTSYQAALSRDMVPETGLEPARDRSHRILSPGRLPFRHSGVSGRKLALVECLIMITHRCAIVNHIFKKFFRSAMRISPAPPHRLRWDHWKEADAMPEHTPDSPAPAPMPAPREDVDDLIFSTETERPVSDR